jgi:hypothetical protein
MDEPPPAVEFSVRVALEAVPTKSPPVTDGTEVSFPVAITGRELVEGTAEPAPPVEFSVEIAAEIVPTKLLEVTDRAVVELLTGVG